MYGRMSVAPLEVLGEAPDTDRRVPGHVPHVVAWNLTRWCNLECAHCYIAAGPDEGAEDDLSTAECLRIADEILAQLSIATEEMQELARLLGKTN